MRAGEAMSCCQCRGIEKVFNQKNAAKELKKYRKKGPSKTTRMLIEALKTEGVEGMTLLDIGGGVGAIQHELLTAGVSSAVDVEASTAYIQTSKEEAARRGHEERVRHYHGNFVDLAPTIAPADIVTLDRVICCYNDVQVLVGLSSERARKFCGIVYPRYKWWNKIFVYLLNFILWVVRNPYRSFLHLPEMVDTIVRGNGLKQRFYRKTIAWQVVVYAR